VLRTVSDRAYSWPLPVFLARSVGGSAPQIFTAPVTHQDLGTDQREPSPFRFLRTRKSSVPCCVQEQSYRSHGFQPTLWWLTAGAAKSPAARICGLGGCLIRQGGFSNPIARVAPYASRITDTPPLVERNMVPQDMVCCPREFVGQRSVNNHTVGPGRLSIVPGPDVRIEAS
jgi:hypothetical protein